MDLWDLSGATIEGQHYFWADAAPLLKAGKPPDVMRFVDAAVTLAQTGLSINGSEEDCGYRHVKKSLESLFTMCRSLAQQLPEACSERRSVPETTSDPTGDSHRGLYERILERIAALVECDTKVTAARDSETTDLGLETLEGKPFYVTPGGPSAEMADDERLETSEELAELVREAVELAGDVYVATLTSRKK